MTPPCEQQGLLRSFLQELVDTWKEANTRRVFRYNGKEMVLKLTPSNLTECMRLLLQAVGSLKLMPYVKQSHVMILNILNTLRQYNGSDI